MQPWFKFYATDYIMDDDLLVLPPEAEGLLVRIWCLCWRDGSAPADPELLALATRLRARYVRKHLPSVLPFFRVESDALFSARMERERSENEARNEIATTLARNAANVRWERERREKSGNGDARRNAVRNAERNACQSQSQSQIEKMLPSEACAEPRSGAVAAPSPDCPVFPTKGPVRSWQATADQVARWRALYPGLDLRHELLKAHTWITDHPIRRKTARGMAGFVANWLNRATDRPRAPQPSLTLPPAPKPPRVRTVRDHLEQEIRDAETFRRTERVAQLRSRLAAAQAEGTADDIVDD